MKQKENEVVIDSKVGNVTDDRAKDLVTLKGSYPFENSEYADWLVVVLKKEATGELILQEVPYSGYGIQLFLGDFTGNGQSEIMVRGDFGGTGNFGIAVIYTYENDQLKEIFSQDSYNKTFECKSEYIEGYKTQISCTNPEMFYTIDLSNKSSQYLDMIYTGDGKVKDNQSPTISGLNTAYPILPVYQDYYDLLIQQRIVGVVNADTIGAVQTIATLYEGIFKIINRALLIYQR